MNKPTLYIDENLQTDYNRLEARHCLCTAQKVIGSLMCDVCLNALAPDVRTAIEAMLPGSGLAAVADLAHSQIPRKKWGWRK